MGVLTDLVAKTIVNNRKLINVYAMVSNGSNLYFADGTDYPNQTNKIYAFDTNHNKIYRTINCTFPVTSLGITSDGVTIIACGYEIDKVFTYNMSTNVGYTYIRKGIKSIGKCRGNILVVDEKHFYVTNGHRQNIARVVIRGPNFSAFDFTTGGSISIPMGIATDGFYLYCNDYADNTIFRATLNHTSPTLKLFPQGNTPKKATDIVYYSGYIVIVDKEGIKAYTISGDFLIFDSIKITRVAELYALTSLLHYSKLNLLPYDNKYDIISQLQ